VDLASSPFPSVRNQPNARRCPSSLYGAMSLFFATELLALRAPLYDTRALAYRVIPSPLHLKWVHRLFATCFSTLARPDSDVDLKPVIPENTGYTSTREYRHGFFWDSLHGYLAMNELFASPISIFGEKGSSASLPWLLPQ
jgi:hypothetical protein